MENKKQTPITKEMLESEYMEWRNNYLSPALFSEHRGLTENEGKALIDLARSAFENLHPDE
jgi:hypothetical protein